MQACLEETPRSRQNSREQYRARVVLLGAMHNSAMLCGVWRSTRRRRAKKKGPAGPVFQIAPFLQRRDAGFRALLVLLGTHHNRSRYSAMRRRIEASGSGPVPACRLSTTCAARDVPGIAQVTAGCESIHLRKNCAQLEHSISAAHGGSSLPLTRRNSAPSANGRLTITATPSSAHAGSSRSAASGSASE